MDTTGKSLLLVSVESATTFPEFLPPIFPKEPMLDKVLKLLLPPSLKFRVFLDLLGFVGLVSDSVALPLWFLVATRFVMLQRQKGQVGVSGKDVKGSGFLWQQRASVQ